MARFADSAGFNFITLNFAEWMSRVVVVAACEGRRYNNPMSPGVFDSLAYMPGAAFSEELAHAAWLSAISRGDETAFRATSMLLKLKPGAELPPHIHGDDEECLVLEGKIVLGEGITMTSGDYHRAFKGAPHGVARSETGALLFLRSNDPAYLP